MKSGWHGTRMLERWEEPKKKLHIHSDCPSQYLPKAGVGDQAGQDDLTGWENRGVRVAVVHSISVGDTTRQGPHILVSAGMWGKV